ncbi:glycosyltransferase [candidate division KSB1 bacterium]|nr:glycosyltransferase [candidate division KSB1 bacterium]RQW11788.1 MAG: glycosyltransferase [candidate division KSB1 bacterium]
MKNVLFIAYHFPPQHGSSGLLRTLKFVRYLEKYDFKATVLTIHTRAYERLDGKLVSQIPDEVHVHRSAALDTKKHLSIKGKYWEQLAVPDRYASWIPFGIVDGCRLVKKHNIDVIFATYPIPSAMVIGTIVSRRTKKPFVADFRDPMYDDYAELSEKALKVRKAIEAAAVANCDHVIVTTPGTRRLFGARYPNLAAEKISVIPNGYDEYDFTQLPAATPRKRSFIRIIHAGLLDQDYRNPLPFFRALQILKAQNLFAELPLKVEFYAPGSDDYYIKCVNDLLIQDIVEVKPGLPYHDILAEMFDSDILLLYQGNACDHQIPAKVYEYLRTGKPILAFATENGDTGQLLSANDAGLIISDSDPAAIAAKFAPWLHVVTRSDNSKNRMKNIKEYSREKHTESLARIFRLILKAN